MVMKTNAGYGDKGNMVKQAVGLFATHTARNTTMSRLTGKMPAGTAGAEATIRNQTSSHMPIVRSQDLGKGTGDEITFHLLNPVNAYPIMGSRYAEGRGVGMDLSEGRLRVNRARFPVDMGNSDPDPQPGRLPPPGPPGRSGADGPLHRPVAAGAYGRCSRLHNNIEWALPTDVHPDFAEMLVNPVMAPSKNRHFIADGAGIQPFSVAAGEVDLTTTDQLKMGVIDGLRTYMEQIALPPPPVIFEGDAAATDSPLRVLLVSPAQYSGFATDPNFRQLQANSMARAQQAKMHPLFLGDAGLWNGILIVKMPKPIRFYAGDTIKYSANYTDGTESSCVVPASFGTNFAVDRAILLGGQAVGEALAASDKSAIPFFWSEKELDHGDKVELLIGAIRGVAKLRFEVDTGDTGKQITDYGVTVLDTAVPIVGARM